MSLKEELNQSLKQAMKDNEGMKKNTLRVLLTNLKLAEVEKGSDLDDAAILSLVQKDIKQHQETIELARRGNREDIIEEAKKEILILESFLPPQMSEEEIRKFVADCIKETNAETISDSGKVMKILMPKIAGRASGSQINAILKDFLSNNR